MMLDADVQAAIVVDRTGSTLGVMTVERVARLMREGDHGGMFGVFGDEPDDDKPDDVPDRVETA